MFPLLETKRLVLREITKEDAAAIYVNFSNPKVTQYYGQETLMHMEQAEQLVDFFTTSFKDKRGIRWGIERREVKGLIGTIGFNAWVPKHKRAEIGYEISEEHWRKGYTSEALHSVLSYGFDELNLTRIGAVVFKDNEASKQLLKKFGFEKEGILRDYMFQNGVPNDTYVYSKLKRDREDKGL